jgi:hypothetical protein
VLNESINVKRRGFK